MFIKLFFPIYNTFQKGDFPPSLLKHVFVINKVLNKINIKYLFDLSILKYIDMLINYRLLEEN